MPVSSEWVQLRDSDAGKTHHRNRPCGSRQRASRSSGSVLGRKGPLLLTQSNSACLSSLHFLPGEGRHRQPRAVYKYWAPCRLCCVEIFFIVNNGHWLCLPRGTLLVLQAITMVQLTLALWVYVHFRAVWTAFVSLSVSFVAMVSQMS